MFRPSLTLTVSTARTVLEAGLSAIMAGQSEIDLADVTVVDSAAVATLLEWQRAALKHGKTLRLNNLPPNLQSLIDLYGVTELLSAAPNGSSSSADARADLPHH